MERNTKDFEGKRKYWNTVPVLRWCTRWDWWREMSALTCSWDPLDPRPNSAVFLRLWLVRAGEVLQLKNSVLDIFVHFQSNEDDFCFNTTHSESKVNPAKYVLFSVWNIVSVAGSRQKPTAFLFVKQPTGKPRNVFFDGHLANQNPEVEIWNVT